MLFLCHLKLVNLVMQLADVHLRVLEPNNFIFTRRSILATVCLSYEESLKRPETDPRIRYVREKYEDSLLLDIRQTFIGLTDIVTP